jgi:hypothetical protein
MIQFGTLSACALELKKVCWVQCASSCAYMRRLSLSSSARPALVTKTLQVVECSGGSVSKGTYAAAWIRPIFTSRSRKLTLMSCGNGNPCACIAVRAAPMKWIASNRSSSVPEPMTVSD